METLRHGIFQHAHNFIKEKKTQDQDNDLIMNIQATTLADITPNTPDDDDHIPWMGVTFPEEESGPVEINRTHNAVKMAYKYAKQHGKGEVTLPEEFKRHAVLFSDEEAKKFPPSQPHNHKIELTPKAPNKFNCKLYPMSLADQAIEDKFLNENLEKGYIVFPTHPMASAHLWCPRRIATKSTISSTIAHSMQSPRKTSPHSPTLLNTSKTSKEWSCLANSIFDGDTTTFASAKATNGKAPSKPDAGYISPKSCSLA